MAKELKWHHHYVKDGVMEPDHLGRWQVHGRVEIEAELMPNFAWVAEYLGGKVPVSIIWIEYTKFSDPHEALLEYTFSVHMPFIDHPDHSPSMKFFAPTLEDAKRMAQEKLDHLVKCLS